MLQIPQNGTQMLPAHSTRATATGPHALPCVFCVACIRTMTTAPPPLTPQMNLTKVDASFSGEMKWTGKEGDLEAKDGKLTYCENVVDQDGFGGVKQWKMSR